MFRTEHFFMPLFHVPYGTWNCPPENPCWPLVHASVFSVISFAKELFRLKRGDALRAGTARAPAVRRWLQLCRVSVQVQRTRLMLHQLFRRKGHRMVRWAELRSCC